MKKILVASAGVCAVALAFAAKDPVIMTVNGVDVPKSEFEYLYNKNSQQQINPQNLEEYVEMFKLYKLKVADARAEGIDTLPSFLKETEQYRHDLSAPYMVDSVYLNKLVKEAYDRSRNEAEAYHIMLSKVVTPRRISKPASAPTASAKCFSTAAISPSLPLSIRKTAQAIHEAVAWDISLPTTILTHST